MSDRAALVRAALRTLVAERGFHGASMSAVATEAGVATGTAYTHYGSKDELVLATYLETKAELGRAAIAGVVPDDSPSVRFRAIWLGMYRHLAAHPDHARFLVQVDASPYRAPAHAEVLGRGDPLIAAAAAPDLARQLLPLPLGTIYELGLAPAIHLVVGGATLTDAELGLVADACWRAITHPQKRER